MSRQKEQPPIPEIPLQLIEAYAKTFIHQQDCYPIQLDQGKYVTLKRSLTPEMIVAHLRGTVTLGVYALDTTNTARWLCLDADQPTQWEQIVQIARTLEAEGVPVYLELSRRGGHCWLFTPPLPGKIIRQFAKQLLMKFEGKKPEIYPKQDELKTGTGSLVRLPLGIHRITGKRYSFITPEGEPLAPTIRQQLALLATPRIVPQTYIDMILGEIPLTPPPLKREIFAKKADVQRNTLSERIKARISVFDFVSRYVELDIHSKGYCPFHDDQHKSFGVHRERNFWHCYAGCGGGSVIDFWMKWRETHGQDGSFTATIKQLREMLLE